MVSFRLGGGDGVAVEAAKWAAALGVLGWEGPHGGGRGPGRHGSPGVGDARARRRPTGRRCEGALAAADLVIVENLCSLPLNPAAAAVVAAAVRRPACAAAPPRPALATAAPRPSSPSAGRPGMGARHHQRAEPHASSPPRGIGATTVYNTFDPDPPPGDRAGVRAGWDLGGRARTPAPTDAGAGAQERAGRHRAGRGGRRHLLAAGAGRGRLRRRARTTVLAGARCPVRRGQPRGRLHHGGRLRRLRRRACSRRRGRGSATLRSSPRRTGARSPSAPTRWRPSCGPSASAGSTRRNLRPLVTWLDRPDEQLVTENHQVAATYFNVADLPGRLARILAPVPGLAAMA